ncbi:MAG: DUF5711 family protein [Lachnospiraceae bacterium]
MKTKNNSQLHIVKSEKDPTDKIIDKIMIELREEQEPIENLEEKIQEHKHRFWFRTITTVALIVMVVGGTYMLIVNQTYSKAQVINAYKNQEADNSQYARFSDGVLRYSKDGVSFLDTTGEEQWNLPCQFQTPLVEVNQDSVVVADNGGNSIKVFQKDGLKGEIKTTLPIEKVAVSTQGIVSVILKNETSPQVVCYDATGNLLVELKASFSNNGYPVDIALSDNGYILLVSYLSIKEGIATTKIVYYNFSEEGQEVKDYQVKSDSYKNEVLPNAFFMNEDTSVIIGNASILMYKGKQTPELLKTIKVDKIIKSSFHNQHYIGLILKNSDQEGYELRLYNKDGKKTLSKNFAGDYKHVQIEGNQVIMYDGTKCSVFSRTGIHKFEGELEMPIQEMFPLNGLNKYLVISTDGAEEIRFVK